MIKGFVAGVLTATAVILGVVFGPSVADADRVHPQSRTPLTEVVYLDECYVQIPAEVQRYIDEQQIQGAPICALMLDLTQEQDEHFGAGPFNERVVMFRQPLWNNTEPADGGWMRTLHLPEVTK